MITFFRLIKYMYVCYMSILNQQIFLPYLTNLISYQTVLFIELILPYQGFNDYVSILIKIQEHFLPTV